MPASKPEGLEADHAEAYEAGLGPRAPDSVTENKRALADQGEDDGVALEPASKPESAGLVAVSADAVKAGPEPGAPATKTKKIASGADQAKAPKQTTKRPRLRKGTADSEEKVMEPA